MKIVLDLLFYFAKASSYQLAARRMKRQGLVIYLKALQISRKSILVLLVFGFIFQVMVMGFIGLAVTGIFLLPEDLNTKLWILFGGFSFLFLVPAIFLCIALSEKTWFKAGRVEEMLAKVDS
jgi:hypothetical protein